MLPEHNERFSKAPAVTADDHRRLGPGHKLESILSIRSERVVSNDYVVRFANRHFQLLKPIYPGQRGGRVIVEERASGELVIRFGKHALNYRELPRGEALGGSAPKPPEFGASAADAGEKPAKRERGSVGEPRPAGRPPTADRRTLGSHSCGALSSRRREGGYPEGTAPSSGDAPVEKELPMTLANRPRKEDISNGAK